MSTIIHSGSVDQVSLDHLYESTVISADGERVGTVIDLVRRDGEVVALEVSGYGMFGVGAGHYRLPVSTINHIDELDVHIDRFAHELG